MTRAEKPAKSARRRRLSEEEIDLWLSVAATVARRPGAILPDASIKAVPIEPQAGSARPPRSLPYAASYTPPAQVPVSKMAPLDRRVKQKLSRGRMSADAAIDLHGFRQAEAHSALRHFILQAQRDGARIVLVVTGKGGRSGNPFDMGGSGVGVLKRSVPLWLAEPEFRTMVIGFEDAGRAHGGAGALYVRLRRRER